MVNLETYLKLHISYKDYYIENNKELSEEKKSFEDIYIAVSYDIDIVFSALNILPNKSGYKFWKDAIFLYLMSEKDKISIVHDIYPMISQKYDASIICIDRAMKRCFENVLYHTYKNESNFIRNYLKNIVLNPHNSELLAKITELICTREFQQNKIKQMF